MPHLIPDRQHSSRTCRHRRSLGALLIAFVASLLSAAPAFANDATDNLLGLVRSDASLVIEIPNLEQQLTRARQSDFINRFVASDLYKNWAASQSFANLAKLRQSTEASTKRPMEELTKDLFGTGVVLALYKTGRDRYSGMLLTEAVSVQFLDSAIQSWNDAEKQETIKHRHADQDYFQRNRIREGKRPDSLYYARIDRVFVLSDKEDLIKPVLELQSKRAKAEASKGAPVENGAILDSQLFRKSRGGIQLKSLASFYINPRDFDHHFPANDAAPRVEQNLASLWRRLDFISVGLNLDDGPVVEAYAQYNNQGLPDAWTKTISLMQKPSDFMQCVPVDAVMAFSGVHDVSTIGKGIAQIAATEDPAQWETFRRISKGLLLGYDLLDDVLPNVSSHVGGYAVPRHTEKPNVADEFPIEALLVFNLPKFGEAAEGRRSIRDGIDNALNTGLNFAAAYLNSGTSDSPAIVRTEERTGAVVRWLDEVGSYRPAYALTTNYLVFASTPDLARRFLDAPSTNTAGMPKRLATALSRYFPNENQAGFVDVGAIRELLMKRQKSLIESAVESKSLSQEESAARMERLLDVAKLFDTAFIAGHIGSDHVRVLVGGTVDSPEPKAGAETR